ncbi:MAG: hypothetical protein GY866_31495 [Proteobacteria bacterium]|nr:hypothetical protein [Pseudomonadota bacterium]
MAVFKGHDHVVNSAVFHPRENKILTAGVDGTIRVWDVDNGRQPVCRFCRRVALFG